MVSTAIWDVGYSWCGLPAELYPHGAETLDFTGFPRYLLLRCEDEIAGCFTGDLLSQVNYESRTYRYALRQMLSKYISQNYFLISSVFWPVVVINKVP